MVQTDGGEGGREEGAGGSCGCFGAIGACDEEVDAKDVLEKIRILNRQRTFFWMVL